MIKEQFLYFAQYPSKDGIRAIFTNGASDFTGYNDLVSALDKLPQTSRIPEIDNYIYGQSFEELQARIDKCIGSFLFVDYGEMSMSGNNHNSYELTQRIAVTVAYKMSNRADAGEYMLASDKTLELLSKVHASMLADADRGEIEWFSRSELARAEYVPFVASELHSVGWTLMLSCLAPDSLQIHRQYKSFVKNKE
ncbi:hypothetical protein CUC00_08445 [Prevotella intermedia]|uniref:hypothetical protein n=1 Tax=Prevotella intermedia TaxID=28131 RepID=UPI000C1B8DAA|nr:hypothetical protein [Prevotella intermedia]ATV32536.1 hypothetical protein CTM44_01490 [Prevotella intermedia]ATV41053.1 hypothetical protein CUC00_08445 [Prevotella intermedia]